MTRKNRKVFKTDMKVPSNAMACVTAMLAACALTAPVFVPVARAQLRPTHREDIPNFDRRATAQAAGAEITQRDQAAARLRAQLTGADINFDPLLGSPKFIHVRGGFLTGPNGQGRAVSGPGLATVSADDPYRAVKGFLNEQSALFGHDASVLSTGNARITRDSVGKHNGLRTVVWQQELDGIPVFGAVVVGNITKRGELATLSSLFIPNPVPSADAGTPNRAVSQNQPPVSAEQAIANAAQNLGDTLTPGEVAADGAQAGDGYHRFLVQGKQVHARLVWLPVNRGALRLCWEVHLSRQTTREGFEILIDAESGEPWLRRDLTCYISDATYNVYTSDSPSPFTPSWPTPNAGQPPLTNRVLLTLSALDTTASPDGWIPDAANETRGNNADTYMDRDFDGQPDGGARPQGNPNRVFDFPLDLTQDPLTYSNASVVQMFYWVNYYHDRLYQLGFTESAGNYQENNFGRGGQGSDSIIGYVQAGADLGFADNAFFVPAPDGINGQIAMFVWDFPTPMRDGDLDAEVIIHEATHGTSWRLVGGGFALGNLQGDGMGEGWSDFYAMSLLSEPGDDPDAVYANGGYVTYQFAGLTENYYFGIRHYPYTTDMTKNPLTFKDIDPTQASTHPGVPGSPLYGGTWNPASADEVHNQGEVWCAMLWEVRANLIHKYGTSAGNDLALQLVTDGMKLTPAQPTWIQARDAIILADLINNGGANANELWAGFAKRGLGFSAQCPPGNTTVGIVEAYDLPGVNVQAVNVSGGNGNRVIDVNECNDIQIVLANFNNFPLTGVRITLSTTTPGVGFGTRSANYSDLAPLQLGTNLVPFTLSTTPGFLCGQPIALQALIKSDQQTLTNFITLDTGVVGDPVRFDSLGAVNIPDDSATNSFITVSNITGALRDVKVSVYLTHSWVGDLRLRLIAPDGTGITLSDSHGGSGANYGIACSPDSSRTTFDDDAVIPISGGFPPYIGSFRPDQALSAFAGKYGSSVNGQWRLRVVDLIPGFSGTIQCWSLFLSPAHCEDGGGTCPGVDLAMSMVGNPEPVYLGSNLVYTITVTNNGPSAATNVIVNHTLPPSVVFVSATSSQGSATHSAGTVVCNIGKMEFASVVTITVTVTPAATGTISSSATVTSNESDTDLFNNTANFTSHVNPPTAELALGLADAPDPTAVGGPLTYTVSLTNKGPSAASFVTVTNVLPVSVSVQSATPSQGTASIFGNLVVFSFGSVPKDGRVTGTIGVIPTAQGTIVATATAAALQADPIPSNNTATAVTTVGPSADLAVTLTDLPDPVVIGSNWTYFVTVTNLGPNTASGTVLNVTLPAGLALVSTNTTQGTLARSGNTITGNLGTLNVGAGSLVTIVVNAAISNVYNATATATAAQTDLNPANNTASASTIVAPPNVTIVAAGATLTAESLTPPNGTVDVGETVTLQLRLRNAGNINNTNLIATLLATGGVTSPSGAQVYGVLSGGGLTVGREFTFTAAGTNGGTVVATLQLQDGPNDLGTATFSFALPVVRVFSNTNVVNIPDSGQGTPLYPSTIMVSGVTGLVGRVTVTLSNVTHTFVDDLDILVARTNGPQVIVMSDSGNPNGVVNTTITLDDTAPLPLPDDGQILSTSYQPADYEPGDSFNWPAPDGPYGSALSAFAGADPNGPWSLYVMDDAGGDSGTMAGGWSVAVYTITPVNQLVDVALSASATPSPGLVESGVTYTFALTNQGPSAASGLAFTNILPAGAILLSAASSQGVTTTNGNTVVCSIPNLSTGAVATVTVVAAPGSAGLLTNTANVAVSETDLNPANNTVSAITAIGLPAADVAVSLAAPTNGVLGSNVTFTITVTNLGPETALKVTVADALPAGLGFVSATPSVGAATNSGNTVMATLGNLNAGAGATLTIEAQVTSIGLVTNTATVATTASDTNTSNNSASAVLALTAPAPNLVAAGAVLATESIVPPNFVVDFNETVTVSLALSNNGTADTANLNATLLAGNGVTAPSGPQNYGAVVRGGAPVARPFTFTATGPNGGVVAATLQLQDGANNLGTVTFNFYLPATTSFTNATAISIPDHGGATPYPATINVSGLAGTVSKVTVGINGLTHAFPDDVDVLLVGPAGQKLIVMSDTGGGHPVTNVTVTLDDAAGSPLPDSTQIASGAYQPADYESGDPFVPPAPAGAAGGALSVFNDTDPNGSWSLYVLDDAIGDAGMIGQGWTLTLTTVVAVNAATDVAVSVSDTPDPAFIGGLLSYTVGVTNLGPSAATGVIVTDTLPAGLNYVGSAASQGTIGAVGNVVTANVGDLAAGASALLTINVSPSLGGSVLNSVSVTNGVPDSNLVNNTAQTSTSVNVPVAPQLSEIVVTSSQVQGVLTGEPTLTYVIQASTNFVNWTAVSTNTLPGGGSAVFTDNTSPVSGYRFYRAVRQLP